MDRLYRRLVTDGWLVALAVVVAVLWRGGKSLDATWMLGGLAVFITLFSYWHERRKRIVTRGVDPYAWFLFAFFVAWSIASFFMSQAQNYGLDEIIRDVALFLVCMSLLRSVRKEGMEWIALSFVAAVTVACAIGFAVYAYQPVDRFVGTFFDYRFVTDYWPNAWAECVLLAWPLAVAWAVRGKLVRGVVPGVLFAGLYLSLSRGAVLCAGAQMLMIVAAGGLLLFRRKEKKVFLRRAAPALLVSVLTAAVCVFGGNAVREQRYAVTSVVARAQFATADGTTSINERRDFWNQAWQLMLQRPILGWGPYSFRFAQQPLQTKVIATSDHPHNVFLKLGMERGVPAALAFAGLLFVFFYAGARKILAHTADASLTLAVIVALTGVVLHNLIDYNMQFVGIALPFFSCIALLGFRSAHRPNRLQRYGEVLIAVVLTAVLLMEGYFLGVSSLGRRAQAAGNNNLALAWYDVARHEVFSRDLHLSRALLRLNARNVKGAQEALDDYRTQNALDPRLWIVQMEVSYPGGDSQVAIDALERAWLSGRYNYLTILERSLFFQLEKKKVPWLTQAEAENVFEAFAKAIARNEHFIALSDNVETLVRVTTLLSRLYPHRTQQLEVLRDAAVENATLERQRSDSRPPGMLW